jgi:hypothetical protein
MLDVLRVRHYIALFFVPRPDTIPDYGPASTLSAAENVSFRREVRTFVDQLYAAPG